ncbi:MAG: 50S ribosomal protein L22 [Candidatus Woesearchaeota archaeon]
MKSGYSFQTTDKMAKASYRNINISTKHAVEICNYIRGRSLSQAKRLLVQSIELKRAIPLKIYTNGPGHKSGMGSGRFHVKACEHVLAALNSAEANAKNKGLNVSELKVTHIVAQKAGKQWHYGRKKRSIFKNAHLEVALEEVKGLADTTARGKSKNSSRSGSSKSKNDSKSDTASHSVKSESIAKPAKSKKKNDVADAGKGADKDFDKDAEKPIDDN